MRRIAGDHIFFSHEISPHDNINWFRNRDFIGKQWSKKYVRAVQAVLNSTHGKIGRGKQLNEIMLMPEALIIKRFEYDQAKREKFGKTNDYSREPMVASVTADEWRAKFYALTNKQRETAFGVIHKNRFTAEDMGLSIILCNRLFY